MYPLKTSQLDMFMVLSISLFQSFIDKPTLGFNLIAPIVEIEFFSIQFAPFGKSVYRTG